MEIAPQHTETFLFDEQTIPIDTETCPIPIEIQPLFHATQTQDASVMENETRIHSIDTPIQTCSVNVSELTPLIISQVNETENVENKQPDKSTATVHLASTFITSSATIGDQVILCDNFDILEMKTMPTVAIAEPIPVPHESKTISEQFISQKEAHFSNIYAPNLKQAHEIISAQCPIEVHEIDVGESEKDLFDKYEPSIQSATSSMLSNIALSTQETLVQNVSTKFYPEMIIATEEATPKFVEQIPYQTQELSITDSENILNVHETPDMKHAHVEFSNLQAITMEQAQISECETKSSHAISSDLLATAKDTITLHKEIQTGFCQIIDSIRPSESIVYRTKQAAISLEEMDGKVIETVNVLQSEQPFDVAMPIIGLEATPNITAQEGFSVSEVLVQESNITFDATAQTQINAVEKHEEHKIAEQSNVQLLDTASEYQRKETEPLFNAHINFELQKSIILNTTITNDSEQIFSSQLQTTEPHYSFDSNVYNPLLVSQIETKETSSDLSSEPIVQFEAEKCQEPFKTYEQTVDQILDTAKEYNVNEEMALHNVRVDFELQKSTIDEFIVVHELEKPFELKSASNQPLYTSESNIKSSVMVSEIQAQEMGSKLSPERTILSTATTTHKSFKAHESSKNPIFETIDDYSHYEMHSMHNAQVGFELQKSMINETVNTHDAEQSFEQFKQIETHPQYSISPVINAPIVVSDTQIIDSVSSLGVKPTDGQFLNISESEKQLYHAGTIAETIPYDATEIMEINIEKGISAKQEPIVFHEVTVEQSTATEQLDQLNAQKLIDQKNATPDVVTKNALNITTEATIESVGKFQQIVVKEQKPNIIQDLVTVNPIIVDETIAADSTTSHAHSMQTATANVSTLKHNAAHVNENWPIETSEDLIKTVSMAEHNLNQKIVESTALEMSTIITSDTFKDFDKPIEKPVEPKYSVNEMKGILTEDVIPHENAEQSQFKLMPDIARGHITHDIQVQNRCEQLAQMAIERAETLQPFKNEKTVSSTKKVSDALTIANVEEIIPSLSSGAFDDSQPMQHHVKVVQENFNVIGQSLQHLQLESEALLSFDAIAKQEFPMKSIEGRASYAINEMDVLEKEMELSSKELNESYNAKTSTEQFLTVANTLEEMTLTSVDFSKVSEENNLKTAVSKLDRLHESVHIEDNIVHEMSTDVGVVASKTVNATTTCDSKKSIQIENVKIFEKEDKLEPITVVPKICDQKIENQLKAATSQLTQIIEQTSVQPEFKVESKLATEHASEYDQNLTFESVYLESHTNLNKSAHVTETPTHAVNVIEQMPLYKEHTFDDKHTEKLLIKPLVATQESTELESAYQESEINTLVNIITDKKADKFTNKKITKKTIETTRSMEVKGRWLIRIHGIYCRNFG